MVWWVNHLSGTRRSLVECIRKKQNKMKTSLRFINVRGFSRMHKRMLMMIFQLLFHFWIFCCCCCSSKLHHCSCNRYDALNQWANKKKPNRCYRNHFLRSYLRAICWICIWLKAGRAAPCKWRWWRWLNAIVYRLYDDDDETM